MNPRKLLQFTIALLLCFLSSNASAWGFWAHKRINRIAVFTLPPEMFTFYKSHIDYITEHAVDPDKRRYATKNEAPRHYIDLDHYCTYPCDSFPKKWNDAVERYSEDTLQGYGIVPWHIQTMMYRLTKAFEERNQHQILKLSSEIGHYIADAHVPLHTTENYNGQLTGQKGIHGFWESRLPELFGEDYNYFVDKAAYIESPLSKTWEFVLESHSHVDSVLGIEKRLSRQFPSDNIYNYETRGSGTVKVYSSAYSRAYNSALEEMVEQRMRSSIIDVGSFWLTCWVNAGQPDLSSLDEPVINNTETEELNQQWKNGKRKGRDHQDLGTDGQ